MSDVIFVGVMLVVCGGIGLPLAALLPRERFPWRDLVAPALGYGVLAVVVLLLYKRDVSMAWMFGAACVLAVAGYASRAVPLLRAARASSAAERRLAWLAAVTTVVATLVVLAPRWSGGDQFAVFQGNQWDTHGYLESGIVVQPAAVLGGDRRHARADDSQSLVRARAVDPQRAAVGANALRPFHPGHAGPGLSPVPTPTSWRVTRNSSS